MVPTPPSKEQIQAILYPPPMQYNTRLVYNEHVARNKLDRTTQRSYKRIGQLTKHTNKLGKTTPSLLI